MCLCGGSLSRCLRLHRLRLCVPRCACPTTHSPPGGRKRPSKATASFALPLRRLDSSEAGSAIGTAHMADGGTDRGLMEGRIEGGTATMGARVNGGANERTERRGAGGRARREVHVNRLQRAGGRVEGTSGRGAWWTDWKRLARAGGGANGPTVQWHRWRGGGRTAEGLTTERWAQGWAQDPAEGRVKGRTNSRMEPIPRKVMPTRFCFKLRRCVLEHGRACAHSSRAHDD